MRTVAILSGGLDSTTALWFAAKESEVALALTFDYGQRAATQEIAAAARLAATLNVPHKVILLPWFRALLQVQGHPFAGEQALNAEDESVSAPPLPATWVPNRNSFFINIAAVYAEALGAGAVVAGFNAEEAQRYPDNSAAFVEAINRCLTYSTGNQVRVWAPLVRLNKMEIIKLGLALGVPYELTWSCYDGGPAPCGTCASCKLRQEAFAQVQSPRKEQPISNVAADDS